MQGGADTRLGFRGVAEEEAAMAGVSVSERPMRRRRRRWGAEVDGGYSASSTSGGGSSGCGSFGCDSPLAGFVRAYGDPETDLETDRLATSSSNGSAVFTEQHSEEDEGVEGDWAQVQEPCKNPADHSTRECLNQRCRSDGVALHGRKGLNLKQRRPASLDFGSPGFNGTTLSPAFVVGGVGLMNKGFVSSHIRSDVFPSPRTPNYRWHRSSVLGHQKGWSSERVPIPSKGNRRYPSNNMAFPFNYGRQLPSKWEDAERWIFSPNSSDAVERTSLPHAQRQKSKSGPLGPPGRFGGQYSSVSLLDSGRVGHMTANSPFLAGVLMPEHYCGGKDNVARYMGRTDREEISIGIGGRSCLVNVTCSDEQLGITEDLASNIAPNILRKDVATQTSPDLSRSSSPNVKTPVICSSTEQFKERDTCFSDLIRDVHMDDRVTLTRWSKKHVTQSYSKNSTNIIERMQKTESKSSSWELEEAKCISKIEREGAIITAWGNLQKPKADSSFQKLVMKLEKKRLSSLDKIWNKFRSTQRNEPVMRETASANQDEQFSRKAKRTSHLTKNGQISSLSGCFTCHAF